MERLLTVWVIEEAWLSWYGALVARGVRPGDAARLCAMAQEGPDEMAKRILSTPTYKCAVCGQPLHERQRGSYIQVTGWVRPREGGGWNAVAKGVPTGVRMCGACYSDHDPLDGIQLGLDLEL